MPATLAALPLAARLDRIARAHEMRLAHTCARVATAHGTPYRAALGPALAEVRSGKNRRAPFSTIKAQALAWAVHVRATGARFNVEKKAAESFAFSVENDLAGFNVPTKLVGVTVGTTQDALHILAAERPAPSAPIRLRLRAECDGFALYFGGDLVGRLQPKHERWARLLPRFGVGAINVTGGTAEHPTRGLNVSLAVWHALPGVSTEDAAADAAAAEHEAERGARHLYGEGPAPSPARLAPTWEALGGWAQ